MRGLFRSYDARAKENLTASRSALFDYFLTIRTGKSASVMESRDRLGTRKPDPAALIGTDASAPHQLLLPSKYRSEPCLRAKDSLSVCL
jgi:hypothetical protein